MEEDFSDEIRKNKHSTSTLKEFSEALFFWEVDRVSKDYF